MRRVLLTVACIACQPAAAVTTPPTSCEAGKTLVAVPRDTPDPDMAQVCTACASAHVVAKDPVVAQPGAQDGLVSRCPVSGVTFQVDSTRPAVEHEGHTYRFCCAGCARMFRSGPPRFLVPACI